MPPVMSVVGAHAGGPFRDPARRLGARTRAGHDHEVLVVEFVDGDVVDDAARVVAHGRVAQLARLHVGDLVDDEATQQALGARPLHVDLAHRRQVLHTHVLAHVEVLVDGRRVGQRDHEIAAAADDLPRRAAVKIVQRTSSFCHRSPALATCTPRQRVLTYYTATRAW